MSTVDMIKQAEGYRSCMYKDSMGVPSVCYGYNLKNYNFPPILIILYFLTLPIKILLAGILNLNRVSNIFSLIQRRFF